MLPRLLSAFAVSLFFASAAAAADNAAAPQTPAASVKPPVAAQPIDSSLLKDAPLSTDFMMGEKDAPVTVIEYASLTCPHCAHFHSAVVPMLENEYISTGKVRYILRQYPLNAPALKAAVLVDCIGEMQGAEQYYTFVKVLFDAQDKWAFDTNYMGALETFASVGGISKEEFQQCINDQEREKKILQIRKSGSEELQVKHTPYIFINDTPVTERITPESFRQLIDARLAGKK